MYVVMYCYMSFYVFLCLYIFTFLELLPSKALLFKKCLYIDISHVLRIWTNLKIFCKTGSVGCQ